MIKCVQRIVMLLLLLPMIIGMLPATPVMGIGLEDIPSEPTQRTEDVPETKEIVPMELEMEATDALTDELQSTEVPKTIGSTASSNEQDEPESIVEETSEDTDKKSIEEEVIASRITLGIQDVPMFFTARAAAKGTHYQRAIIWLSSTDSELEFKYDGTAYSVNRFYVHGVKIGSKNYVGYCIDPGVATTESSNGYSGTQAAWSKLSADTQSAIGLALLYGAPNGISSSTKKTMLAYELATQIIVHEIILGYRSNQPPYKCSNTKIIRKFGTNADGSTNGKKREITSSSTEYSSLHGEYITRSRVRKAYDSIAANMASHYVLPSFASSQEDTAQTFEMSKQTDGSYSVTLTDDNNVLDKCTFINGNGLKYSVSENQLTITADAPFSDVKSCAMVTDGGSVKNVPNLEKESFLLWKSGSYQRLVTLTNPQNIPTTLYFNVKMSTSNGSVQITKTLCNPESATLEGWSFSIHNYSETNGVINTQLLTTVATGKDGTVLHELPPGQYLIEEELDDSPLWECVSSPSVVISVEAGQTSEISFSNALRPGKIAIVKTDTLGNLLQNTAFLLEWSADGSSWTPVTDTTSSYVSKGTCSSAGLNNGILSTVDTGTVTFTGLHPELYYRVTEVSTTNCNQLMAEPLYEGRLPNEDLTVTIRVVNNSTFVLPHTGSNFLALIPVDATICIVICVGLLFLLHREKKES